MHKATFPRSPLAVEQSGLSDFVRQRAVEALMDARRWVRDGRQFEDPGAVASARQRVDAAKRELGERGPVWWTDGSKDYSRYLLKNTPYAERHASLSTPPGSER